MKVGYAPPIGVFIGQMERLETSAMAGAQLMRAPLTAGAGTSVRQQARA